MTLLPETVIMMKKEAFSCPALLSRMGEKKQTPDKRRDQGIFPNADRDQTPAQGGMHASRRVPQKTNQGGNRYEQRKLLHH